MLKRAIYPGSFDPVTFGHIDVIRRAARIFDEVVVALACNPRKKALFSKDERLHLLRETTRDIKGVRIEAFDGLVIEYARQQQIYVLIRGLRMLSDFEFEFQMALTNRRLDEEIETVFLMPSERYSFTSSTLLKEAASLGADVASFVPPLVVEELKRKLKS